MYISRRTEDFVWINEFNFTYFLKSVPKISFRSGTRISRLSEQINVAEIGSRTFCPD